MLKNALSYFRVYGTSLHSEAILNTTSWLAIGLLFGVAANEWLFLSLGWGHRIPQRNLASDYATALAWATFLSAVVACFPASPNERVAFLLVWLVKTITALGLMLPYESHYGLDAYTYWEMAACPTGCKEIFANLKEPTILLPKLIHISWHILPTSYHATKITFAFIGMSGIYFFYRGLATLLGSSLPNLLLVGLTPSILFWTSILGKDPIVFLGISLFFSGICTFLKKREYRGLLFAVLGTLIFGIIRGWLVLLFAAALGCSIIIARLSIRRKLIVVAIFVLFFPAAQNFFSTNYFNYFKAESLVENINAVNRGFTAAGGSVAKELKLDSNADIAFFLPYGMFTALFRPLLWDVLNFGGLLAGFENFFLLWFFVMGVIRLKGRLFTEPILLWALTTIIVFAIVYAPLSVGNMGAGVRYRTQILPFLLLIIFWDFNKRREPSASQV